MILQFHFIVVVVLKSLPRPANVSFHSALSILPSILEQQLQLYPPLSPTQFMPEISILRESNRFQSQQNIVKRINTKQTEALNLEKL